MLYEVESRFLGVNPEPVSVIPFNAKRNNRLIMISLVILSTFCVLDFFYGRTMFLQSIKISVFFQKIKLYYLQILLSYVYFPLLMIYFFVIFFLRKNRIEACYLLFCFFVVMWTQCILKLIKIDSRPSFESTELQSGGFFCENDYGNPSGHSILTATLTPFVIDDLDRNRTRISSLFKFLLCGLSWYFVGMSRIWFGVHSYNQVIGGLLWGTTLYLLLRGLKPYAINWFFKLLIQEEESEEERLSDLERSVVIRKTSLQTQNQFLLRFILVLLFFNGPLIALYLSARPFEDLNYPFFQRIVNCKETISTIFTGFSTKIYVQGSFVNFFIFLMLGAKLSHFDFFKGTWYSFDNNKWTLFLKLSFTLLVLAFLTLVFEPKSESSFEYVLKASIIFPLFGFLMGKYLISLTNSLGGI